MCVFRSLERERRLRRRTEKILEEGKERKETEKELLVAKSAAANSRRRPWNKKQKNKRGSAPSP